jgi:hypothetical protein
MVTNTIIRNEDEPNFSDPEDYVDNVTDEGTLFLPYSW